MLNPIYEPISNHISAGKFTGILLALLLFIIGFSPLQAIQYKLSRTLKTGNTITLTVPAQIVSVSRNAEKTTFSIWRNGKNYITVNNKHNPQGILPPGTYVVRTSPGGSATITLETNIRPENVKLWGRQNALVKPQWEGNQVVITAPTTITSATYNGTKGMSLVPRVLYYLSPHNRVNPGPKVLDGAGKVLGKTLVGLTLAAGVYSLVPERGTADGIVYGEIVLKVK